MRRDLEIHLDYIFPNERFSFDSNEFEIILATTDFMGLHMIH